MDGSLFYWFYSIPETEVECSIQSLFLFYKITINQTFEEDMSRWTLSVLTPLS